MPEGIAHPSVQYEALLARQKEGFFHPDGAAGADGDVIARSRQGQFIEIGSINNVVNPPPGKTPIGKFHLSVDPRDVAKAWNLIADRLVNDGMHAKVVTPEGITYIQQNFPGSEGQAGIVISFNPDNVGEAEQWTTRLSAIERTFVEHGIRPGPDISSGRKIPGGRYTHLEHGDGEYENGKALNKWNDALRGRSDPFKDVEIVKPAPPRIRVADDTLTQPITFKPVDPPSSAPGYKIEKTPAQEYGEDMVRQQ